MEDEHTGIDAMDVAGSGRVKIDVVGSKSPELCYVTPTGNQRAIIRINDKDVEAPLHPVTVKDARRHRCTEEMVKLLEPVDVGPEIGDIIDIDFGGGLVNTVYYCHRDATEPALQKVHQIYRDYKDRLEKYYLDVENSDRHADSKAGGSSVAMGLGCLNPGPKRRSKNLRHSCLTLPSLFTRECFTGWWVAFKV